MKELISHIQNAGDSYLIIDGTMPFLTSGFIKEEAMVFNLGDSLRAEIYVQLNDLFGISISDDSPLKQFSFGQKIIIAVYFAASSPATRISISNSWSAVSKINRDVLSEFLRQKITEEKEILGLYE